MHIITRAQFNAIVAFFAEKHGKTPSEIRDFLTTEELAKIDYRIESLVEQLQREGVNAREKMVIEHLQEKGLI